MNLYTLLFFNFSVNKFQILHYLSFSPLYSIITISGWAFWFLIWYGVVKVRTPCWLKCQGWFFHQFNHRSYNIFKAKDKNFIIVSTEGTTFHLVWPLLDQLMTILVINTITDLTLCKNKGKRPIIEMKT